MAAVPKGRRRRGKPGRPLPTTISEIRSKNLNDDAKNLVLELLKLAIGQFGTLKQMARAAMAVSGSDRLHWARGTPDDPQQLNQVSSRVSKFLGSSADTLVDWPTVHWLVQACVPDDERESMLARFAGLWCAANGKPHPPGYLGRIQHEHVSRPELTDPELVDDDVTRAELYRQHLEQALSQQQELEQQLQERDIQIADLKREHDGQMADLARREDDAELARKHLHEIREEYAKLDIEHWKLQTKLAQADLRLRQEQTAREQVANQLERAEVQMARLSHHLGVVVAHVLTRANQPLWTPGQILPTDGLKMDPVLRSMLDVKLNPAAGPMTRWLAVYLRSLLTGMTSHRALANDPALSGELDAVVTGQQLPSNQLLDTLLDRHHFMRQYGVVLRSAAIRSNEHLELSATASEPAHLASSAAANAPDVRPRVDHQVTVAELLERHGIPLRRRAVIERPRHLAPAQSAPPPEADRQTGSA